MREGGVEITSDIAVVFSSLSKRKCTKATTTSTITQQIDHHYCVQVNYLDIFIFLHYKQCVVRLLLFY